MAVQNQQWDIVALLLEHGASLSTENHFGHPPLIFSVHDSLAELWLIKLLVPDKPLQIYKTVVTFSMFTKPEDHDQRLCVLMYLLERLLPLQLTSVHLTAKGLYVNEARIPLVLISPQEELEMFCHLLEQTCVTMKLSILVDDVYSGEGYVTVIHEMVEAFNSTPSSLRKLAVLAIRQCVLQRKSSSSYGNLGLPHLLLSMVQWADLGMEIHEMRFHLQDFPLDNAFSIR